MTINEVEDKEEEAANNEVGVSFWDLGLDVYILPQPKGTTEYVKIPRLARAVPFGYKLDEEDAGWLVPIPLELDALAKAKKFLKQYPSRKVAAWLGKVTGREISHMGLLKRVKSEQTIGRKSTTYRELARRYEAALKKAKDYEERIGKTDNSFFDSSHYRSVESTFSNNDDE